MNLTRHLVVFACCSAILCLSGCPHPKSQDSQDSQDSPGSQDGTLLSDQLLMANLWLHSAEYRALCHQSFNLAKDRLDQALTTQASDLPSAVVVDCDDTVLATRRYGAWMIAAGNTYTRPSWSQWLRDDPAIEVPGAGDFLAYAESRGVTVFYVTNRHTEDNNFTLAILAHLGFPNADAEHLLAKTSTSDKSERRAKIAETHTILLLIGDNLGDFDQVFQQDSRPARTAAVDDRAAEFGKHFIVLPNPTYGQWEKVLYGGEKLSDAEKSARRKAALDPWQPAE